MMSICLIHANCNKLTESNQMVATSLTSKQIVPNRLNQNKFYKTIEIKLNVNTFLKSK